MPLVDTGLVCRYYFDEAASGQAPTSVADASSNNLPLTEINYGGTNLNWVEPSAGQRGLNSASVTGTQRARRTIGNSGDALRTALSGAQKVTIELVVRVDLGNANVGRVFAINDRAGGIAQLGVTAVSAGTSVRVYINGNDQTGDISNLSSRSVYHVVIDSTLATAADRVKVSVNGGTLSSVGNGSLSLNETLSLPSDLDLIAFNRESTGTWDRSFDGALFYAAIYNVAFDSTRITDHYDVLVLDDDTPVGGGGGGSATGTTYLRNQLTRSYRPRPYAPGRGR